MLNIEEIKKQCNSPHPMYERDVDRLIAEVERLTDQHKCDVHNIAAMRTTLNQQAKNCEKLIESYKESNLEQATENYELEQENATLKKALELMATGLVENGRVDYWLCDDIPQSLHLKYQPKNDGNYENEPCIQCVQEYFIQQAQKQEANHAE